jgi:hypothetical protein
MSVQRTSNELVRRVYEICVDSFDDKITRIYEALRAADEPRVIARCSEHGSAFEDRCDTCAEARKSDPVCTCPRDRPVTMGHAVECPRKLRATVPPQPSASKECDALIALKYDTCECTEKCEPCRGVRQKAIEEIERLRPFEKMHKEATRVLGDDEVLQYVTSGNAIPVTRCTVSADLIRQLVGTRRAAVDTIPMSSVERKLTPGESGDSDVHQRALQSDTSGTELSPPRATVPPSAGWIGVKDRLPTHIYSVLAWVTDAEDRFFLWGDPHAEIAVWNQKRGKWQCGGYSDGDDIDVIVTHWMDLPEGPAVTKGVE